MSVLCFGGVDWWYHNRAHVDIQLIRRYTKKGPVLYVNSIVMQKPKITKGRKFIQKLIRKSKSIFRGLNKVDTNFWVYSPISVPLHHMDWSKKLNEKVLRLQLKHVLRTLGLCDPLIWVVCPAACDIALKLRRTKLVYLRTDAYELFPNVDFDAIKMYDRKLKANSDLTLFVSSKLYDEEAPECKESLLLDHGVDYDMFAAADSFPDAPLEMRQIRRPIIGYFGSIDSHTVDYGLIEKLTDLLPEMSFVFVGRVYSDYPTFARKDNVWMLGQKDYDKIPFYGKCFDVAIMPWRQTSWIQACNPIKLKEYLALGKPTVSTPFAELNKYLDVIHIAKSPEDFAACISEALAENGPEQVAARRRKVEKASWDNKAEQVLERLFSNKRSAQEELVDV